MMVICKLDSGEVVGMGGVNAVKEGRVADVGVLIEERWQRRGFGKEALVATVEWAFSEEGGACDGVLMETMSANRPFRALVRVVGLEEFEIGRDSGMGFEECVYRFSKADWVRCRAISD